jgi:hypothetical protein
MVVVNFYVKMNVFGMSDPLMLIFKFKGVEVLGVVNT